MTRTAASCLSTARSCVFAEIVRFQNWIRATFNAKSRTLRSMVAMWSAKSLGDSRQVDGLPQGVQLIGARFREDLLLDAAQVIEDRAPAIT